MRSDAVTVDEYLDRLPAERRAVLSAVRDAILRHLPDGYEERIASGMISYQVPLARYPKTYNGQPLDYVALAAQKGYYAVYLMGAYQEPEQRRLLEEAFRTAGRKLDMGKSCLRFKRLEDLPLDVLGQTIASTPVDRFIERHEANRQARAASS